MHPLLKQLGVELNATAEAVAQHIPDNALNLATGNVGVAGVTQRDLLRRIHLISERLEAADPQEIGEKDEEHLRQLGGGLQWATLNTVPQMIGGVQVAIPAMYLTLDAIERALEPYIHNDKSVALEAGKALRRAATQVRGMESRLRDLAPKTASIKSMLDRIEQAYETADQLPADLESLSEARQRISAISTDAEKDRGQILAAKEAVETIQGRLKSVEDEAAAVLKQCESVYSSVTSVGLAAAFDERSRGLGYSIWAWTAGLVAALTIGGVVGSGQLKLLSGLLVNPDASASLVVLNIVLSVLSVGAPIWFAWLATKQIGQRFRISEDYAFKAAVSRAYEGYRREASRLNPDLETQLLSSAMQRLDEQPLRLVEPASYGSPWHELLSSELMKDALKTVPGFAERLSIFTKEALEGVKPKKKPIAAVGTPPKPVTETESSAG